MKVIEKSVTPFGTEIQLEDWYEEYPSDRYMIAAYPIAENSEKFSKRGEPFRISISANKYMCYTDDDVLYDYEALKSGEKTLADLREHFWNKKSDCYRLGIEED
jgi:hypothetical protein